MLYIQHVTVVLAFGVLLFLDKGRPLLGVDRLAINRLSEVWLADRVRADWGILLLLQIENAVAVTVHREVEVGLFVVIHLIYDLLVAHLYSFGSADASSVVLTPSRRPNQRFPHSI